MKKLLLCFFLVACFTTVSFSQELYSNTSPSSRVNPRLGAANTPIIAFDDINIPASKVEEGNSINVTKVKVGIRRIANAPATRVNVYYTPLNEASTTSETRLSLLPVLLGSINLPVNGPSLITEIISLGDSITTLFNVKPGAAYTGYQTFFIGVSLDNPNYDNGIGLSNGASYNADTLWIYDADDVNSCYTKNFNSSPKATFNIEVFGTQATSLPITLSSFGGLQKDAVNILQWTTENEKDNKSFEVQRSADGVTFTTIGTVEPKGLYGSSASKNSYEFSDTKAVLGNNYYRLKQVDKDGKLTISAIVLLKVQKPASIVLSGIYPNPANKELNLQINARLKNNLQIVITDLLGKVVIKVPTPVVLGNNRVTLNIAKLSAGSYMVKAICANDCETQVIKFIKQ